MPRRCPAEVRRQVIELARSGTKVAQLAETFGMSDATIYTWLKQEKIDRGEVEGTSTDQALELAAAKRRIKQLELVVVEYVSWFNHERLRESVGDGHPASRTTGVCPPGPAGSRRCSTPSRSSKLLDASSSSRRHGLSRSRTRVEMAVSATGIGADHHPDTRSEPGSGSTGRCDPRLGLAVVLRAQPRQRLYLRPEPHPHGSLRPGGQGTASPRLPTTAAKGLLAEPVSGSRSCSEANSTRESTSIGATDGHPSGRTSYVT